MKSTAFSIFVASAIVLNVQATILNVPSSFSTIQSAINASSNGDTIAVSPGTYSENINFRGKNVLLTSLYYLASDTSYILSTLINGSTPVHPDTASCVIFNSGEDSTAILQGFTITGGSGTKWLDIHGAGLYREGGGILIELSAPTIRHNMITNNLATDITGVTSSGGGGIRIGDGNPGIYGNVISFNQGRYGAGIVLNYTGCKIKNNIIFSNTGGQQYYGGSGIWISSNHTGTPKIIENNTIVGNYSSAVGGTGGVSIWSATDVFIRNNIVWDNFPAPQIKNIGSTLEVIYCDVEGGYTGTGNIDQDPFFTSQSFFLNNSSSCIDAGDSAIIYNDINDPGNPGHALFPSKGLLRNDIGAYGGPYASLFPSFATITGINEINIENTVSIFPNPFSVETTIKTKTKLQNATFRMYNALGQETKEINNISGQEIKIRRDNLQPGVYFIRLTQNNKIIAENKLLIID
jgi:Secretion system C-terminal sorting domain/Protein of unknown function (DUF1565)